MYAGVAYGSAPYADGAVVSAPPVAPTTWPVGAPRMRGGSGVAVDNMDPVALPAAAVRAYRMDVVLAYPLPDLVNGRPT